MWEGNPDSFYNNKVCFHAFKPQPKTGCQLKHKSVLGKKQFDFVHPSFRKEKPP
jgi:hypothetical protein